jgi:hypothetical protein
VVCRSDTCRRAHRLSRLLCCAEAKGCKPAACAEHRHGHDVTPNGGSTPPPPPPPPRHAHTRTHATHDLSVAADQQATRPGWQAQRRLPHGELARAEQHDALHASALQRRCARRQLAHLCVGGGQQQAAGALPLQRIAQRGAGLLLLLLLAAAAVALLPCRCGELLPQRLAVLRERPSRAGGVAVREPDVALACTSRTYTVRVLFLETSSATRSLRAVQGVLYGRWGCTTTHTRTCAGGTRAGLLGVQERHRGVRRAQQQLPRDQQADDAGADDCHIHLLCWCCWCRPSCATRRRRVCPHSRHASTTVDDRQTASSVFACVLCPGSSRLLLGLPAAAAGAGSTAGHQHRGALPTRLAAGAVEGLKRSVGGCMHLQRTVEAMRSQQRLVLPPGHKLRSQVFTFV